MMKILLLVAASVGSCLAFEWGHPFSTEQLELENVRELFQTWRFFHSKTYSTTEEEMRRLDKFQLNLESIAESNDRYYAGERKYLLAMNGFGDLSEDEFLEVYNNPNPDLESHREEALSLTTGESSLSALEDGAIVDWAAAGYAMPVKSQGGCGSCYAFSLVGALECNYGIKHGLKEHLLLSEQQVVDCSVPYGNFGCGGGWETKGWRYIQDIGGLCVGDDYPYTGKDGVCNVTNCYIDYRGRKRYKGYYPPTTWGMAERTTAGLVAELKSNGKSRCLLRSAMGPRRCLVAAISPFLLLLLPQRNYGRRLRHCSDTRRIGSRLRSDGRHGILDSEELVGH